MDFDIQQEYPSNILVNDMEKDYRDNESIKLIVGELQKMLATEWSYSAQSIFILIGVSIMRVNKISVWIGIINLMKVIIL